VAILQDLAGIKLRLGRVEGAIRLNVGEEVWLTPEESSSQRNVLPFPQPAIIRDLRPGNLMYIADGMICLEVIEALGLKVKARVRNGGVVSSFKGVNLPGAKIDLPVLTEADKKALEFGVAQDVDWVAVSFVRTAQDIREVKSYLERIGSKALVMAKLEKREAIQNVDAILEEVNAVMVARGDLGVEMPMETVPTIQKDTVRKANEAAKISVIATQMLLSMIDSPKPTRAEISDVANAVLDGCDAIMLSDETTVGKYPVDAVRYADAAIREVENSYPYYKAMSSRDRTQAIASAASDLVGALNAKPIVLTTTGRAAFEVSRFRPNKDIIVFSHDEAILRKVCLGWGLAPMEVIPKERDVPRLVSTVILRALATGLVTDSDVVTIVHGFLTGVSGTTNTIQVLDMKEYFANAALELVTAANR
jgi:pyruvate kinase